MCKARSAPLVIISTMHDMELTYNNTKKTRLSAKLKQAIDIIVYNGLNVNKVAESMGMQRGNLARQLKSPAAIAYKKDIIGAFLASGTDYARVTLVKLLDSKSDDVRHKAARTLLELSGELGKSSDQSVNFGDVQFIFNQHPPQQMIDNQLTIDQKPQVIHVVTPSQLDSDVD